MMHVLDTLLPSMTHVHMLGYWIALLFAFSETVIGIGLFIPGSSALLIMGAMAAGGSFDIGDLIFFAVCGAILGDNINYAIGRKLGESISTKGFWFIRPDHIQKAHAFFERHGSKSVFLGRFVPSMKEVVPFIAGSVRMRRARFMIWNILGGIGWSLVWILPGYFFAASLNTATEWISRTGFLLLYVVAFVVIGALIKWLIVRKGQAVFLLLKSLWASFKQSFAQNKELKAYAKKHPRLVSWLAKRVNPHSVWGRPATFLFLIFVYVSFLFGGVIESLLKSEVITSIDIRVSHVLLLFRDKESVQIFWWITALGKAHLVLVIVCAVTALLWLLKKRMYLLPFWITVFGGIASSYLGKIVFHRPRPEFPVYVETSFSFPSGHATIAIALYGFLAYILIQEVHSWKKKVNIFFGAILLAILIGLSRLYLGVHYVSDILGGYLLGFLWLIVGISIAVYLGSRQTNNIVETISKKMKILVSLIVVAVMCSYVFIAIAMQPMMNLLSPTHLAPTHLAHATDVFSSDQLRYTETLTGRQQEPISFLILVQNDDVFVQNFEHAGWLLADRVDLRSMVHIVSAALYKTSYQRAPMTPSFWNAQTHVFGFEKPTDTDTVGERHHARFWDTGYIMGDGRRVFVGTVSFDNQIKWGITHQISPDIDTERETLFHDLQSAGVISGYTKEKTVDPDLGKNFTGDQFFTDGQLYVIQFESV